MGAAPADWAARKSTSAVAAVVVPSSENSAVFCEIGRSCPLHCAQPVGAKLPAKMRISATNGDVMEDAPDSRRFVRVCDGKIPNSERMKFTTRNGTMLSCGWLPPVAPPVCGENAVSALWS